MILLLVLRPGHIVILDNLGSHRRKAVRQLIRSVCAKLFFLPQYSPDLNPLEQSATHSMPSPPMNAPTTSKIQAIEANAITLSASPSNAAAVEWRRHRGDAGRLQVGMGCATISQLVIRVHGATCAANIGYAIAEI